jgi:CHAT domain-containing protein
MTRRIASLRLSLAILLAAAAGCARPPSSAYSGQSGSGAGAADAVALGANAAGEACVQAETEPGRAYAISCGNWKQPSAILQRGDPATGDQLAALATGSTWRQRLDTRLSCGEPSPSTILGGPALLLRCNRRLEGFPQTAFVALVDGRAWYADGVPSASLVMERALALDTGRIGRSSLGTVTESPGLAAERLATRAVSSNDMAHYQDLQRTAVRANLTGEYASAEVAYRSMATLQRRVLSHDNPALARAMALQALQISNQGRYPEATALLDRAEALASRSTGEDDTALALVWHYEGLNLLNQGRPQDALPLLARAERGYLVVAPDSEDRATGRAATNSQAGDLIPTDPNTRAAAFGVVEARRAQAVAYRMLGQFPRSVAEAHSAARVLVAYGLSNLKATARISRTEAMVLQASGHESAALAEMQVATTSFGQALPGSRAFGQTQLLLAARLSQDGQVARATETCRSAGRVLRGAAAGVDAESLQPCLALLARPAIAGDQGVAREMFLLSEQAQGNTTSQQIALVSARLAESAKNPRVGELIRNRDDTNLQLAELYAKREDASAGGGKDADAIAKQIVDAEHRRDGLEQALQSASPNYGQLVQQAVSADDILGALRPHEAFAAIVLGRTAGYTFVFSDGRITVVPIDGGAGRVDGLVARIRHSMDASTDALQPFDTAAASELYGALFGPSGSAIGQASALTVAPGGTLLSIPFGLLLTGPGDPAHLVDAPFLIRRLVVAHVPAPANFVSLRHNAGNSRATQPWFGFGDFRPVTKAQAQASFPPATCHDSAALFANLQLLPGARAELAQAAGQLGAGPAQELLGPSFTAAAVQKASLHDYRLLHFATHAILQTDLACQAEPALVTSAPPGATDAEGALLTASQIAGMKLDADGVLLSACNTGGAGGSAPGESLSGLARSFFYAGARSMLVTHWDVNDKVTAVLVSATLANMRADPSIGIAAALANAQRRLLERAKANLPNLAHPFFWAPLALIGEGRAVPAARLTSGEVFFSEEKKQKRSFRLSRN